MHVDTLCLAIYLPAACLYVLDTVWSYLNTVVSNLLYVFSFCQFYPTASYCTKEVNESLFVRVVIGDGVYLPVNSCKACEEDRTVKRRFLAD